MAVRNLPENPLGADDLGSAKKQQAQARLPFVEAARAYRPTADDLYDLLGYLAKLKLGLGLIQSRLAKRESSRQADGPTLGRLIASHSRMFTRRADRWLRQILESYRTGHWLLHQGVTPFIAALYLRHFDVRKAPKVSSFWAYAGLAPGRYAFHRRAASAAYLHHFVLMRGRCGPGWLRHFTVGVYRRAWAADLRGRFADKAARLQQKAEALGVPYPPEWQIGRLGRAYWADYVRRQAMRVWLGRFYYVCYVDFYGTKPKVRPFRCFGVTISLKARCPNPTSERRPLSELYEALDRVRGRRA